MTLARMEHMARIAPRDFGHDPATLDRVAYEHCLAIAERARREREREEQKEAA